ncbi:MAG: hypothetical protein Q8S73_10500 [Deltaproteobacteria bacterium]|nr:hypothetical protein [Myxococcales bacterium]MDP3214523.1 hypothetical protein [Deltaproteobacteria bacterium]
MATKAQAFRAAVERSSQHPKPAGAWRINPRGSADHRMPERALSIHETIEASSPPAHHAIGGAHARGNTVRARRG